MKQFRGIGLNAWLLSGTCLLAGGYSPAAFAQEGVAPTEDAMPVEIIVTAQRRDERLSRVPISISAYSGEQLQKLGATSMADISRATPGFHVVPGATIGGGSNVSIRGISTIQGAATIGIYLDDVPVQGRANNWTQPINPGLFDMERVEVLRGPQGTLFGASSQGGTLRFITNSPSLTYWSGQALAEMSVNERGGVGYQTALALGGPIITDKIGFRASIDFRQDPGFIDRVSRPEGRVLDENINDTRNLTGRFAITFSPSENLAITPQVHYQRLHGDDLGLIWTNEGIWPTTGRYQNREERLTPYTDETVIGSIKAVYDLPGAVLTSITSLRDRKLRRMDDYSGLVAFQLFRSSTPSFLQANPSFAAPQTTESTQKSYTQEVRLSSADQGAPIYGTIGAFYSHTRQTLTQVSYAQTRSDYPAGVYLTAEGPLLRNGQSFNTYIPSGPAGSENFLADKYQLEVDEQIAGFIDATWNATEKLKLSAGARVAKQFYNFQYIASGYFSGGDQILPKTESNKVAVNPKISASYQATSRDLFYATVSKGQRPGGVNRPIPASRCAVDIAQVGSVPQAYTDDTVWSYEAGAKNRLLDDKVSVNASAFYLKWKNIQQNLILANCNFSYVGNFGSATSKGFDISAQIAPTRSIRIGANVGYTDATLDSDTVGSVNAATGIAPILAKKGSKLALVPEWTADISVDWTHDLAWKGASLFVRADYQYQGKFARTPAPGSVLYNPVTYAGEAYDVVNLKLGIDHDRWRGTLFVNNLTNSYPILFRATQAGLSGFMNFETTLAPRTFGVNVSTSW